MNMSSQNETRSRRIQHAATRERVILAAADIFRERGFAGATIRAIAARAGVSTGTVCGVGNKAQLLTLATRSSEPTLEATLIAVEQSDGVDVLEVLLQLSRVLLTLHLRHPVLTRELLAQELFPATTAPGPLSAHLQPARLVVERLLARGVRAGSLPVHLDVAIGATTWLATYQFALLAVLHQQLTDPVGFLERTMAQHLRLPSPRRHPSTTWRASRRST